METVKNVSVAGCEIMTANLSDEADSSTFIPIPSFIKMTLRWLDSIRSRDGGTITRCIAQMMLPTANTPSHPWLQGLEITS